MASVMCWPMAPVPPNIRIVKGSDAMTVGQSSISDDLVNRLEVLC